MKKILLMIFILSNLIISCKNDNNLKNINSENLLTSDEIFKTKDTLTNKGVLNFLKQYYVAVNFEESIKNDPNLNKEALKNLITKYINEDYTIQKDKFFKEFQNKLFALIKKSNSKKVFEESHYNLLSEYGDYGFGYSQYSFGELSDDLILVNRIVYGMMNMENIIFKLQKNQNGDYNYIKFNEDSLSKLTESAIVKLEKEKNTKFERQGNRGQVYHTTTINGDKYFTLPFYEIIEGDECPGCGHVYNLLLAYSFKTDKFFYLYDNPKINTDDWKFDKNEGGDSCSVPTNNSTWISIQ